MGRRLEKRRVRNMFGTDRAQTNHYFEPSLALAA